MSARRGAGSTRPSSSVSSRSLLAAHCAAVAGPPAAADAARARARAAAARSGLYGPPPLPPSATSCARHSLSCSSRRRAERRSDAHCILAAAWSQRISASLASALLLVSRALADWSIASSYASDDATASCRSAAISSLESSSAASACSARSRHASLLRKCSRHISGFSDFFDASISACNRWLSSTAARSASRHLSAFARLLPSFSNALSRSRDIASTSACMPSSCTSTDA